MNTLAKCPYCETEIMLNRDIEAERCSSCGRLVTTAEAIHKRNVEIATGGLNDHIYKTTRTQKAVASIICLCVCFGGWQLVEPEIYKLTGDHIASIAITVIIAITICNVVFRFCTK